MTARNTPTEGGGRSKHDELAALLAQSFGHGVSFLVQDREKPKRRKKFVSEARESRQADGIDTCLAENALAEAVAQRHFEKTGELPDDVAGLDADALQLRPVKGSCTNYDPEDDHAGEGNIALRVARETEVLELARRSIDLRHPPVWLAHCTEAERETVLAWNAKHSIRAKGKARPREFAHWRYQRVVLKPLSPRADRAVIALADARLSGPLWPVLELYALEDWTQVEVVLRYLKACGHDQPIALHSLAHWMFPAKRHQAAIRAAFPIAGGRADYYRSRRAVVQTLNRWLHAALRAFHRAYAKA